MYRRTAGEDVTWELLTFRPTAGVWWHGRIHFTGFPSGLASWAPDDALRVMWPDVTLFSARPDGAGLLLAPCTRAADGQLRRHLLTKAWRLSGEGVLEEEVTGPEGVSSSSSGTRGWTAVAHPETDLVRLQSPAGVCLAIVCYYPVDVAWVGTSLLVGTVGGELLLFERLLDVLGPMG
jgi:hypothetical protein